MRKTDRKKQTREAAKALQLLVPLAEVVRRELPGVRGGAGAGGAPLTPEDAGRGLAERAVRKASW